MKALKIYLLKFKLFIETPLFAIVLTLSDIFINAILYFIYPDGIVYMFALITLCLILLTFILAQFFIKLDFELILNNYISQSKTDKALTLLDELIANESDNNQLVNLYLIKIKTLKIVDIDSAIRLFESTEKLLKTTDSWKLNYEAALLYISKFRGYPLQALEQFKLAQKLRTSFRIPVDDNDIQFMK